MDALTFAAYRAHERAVSLALAQWRAGSQINWRADLVEEANARRAELCPCGDYRAPRFSRTRFYERLYQDSLQGVVS